MQQLWKALNRMPPSLIVLDNFPEQIPLRPYLPTTGRIHTLVTTRRQDLRNLSHVRLDPLAGEDGIQLLNSGARQLHREEAEQLVERLGGLPLALEITKAFLNYRIDVTVRQILTEMDKSGEIGVLRGFTDVYRDELPSGHEIDIAQTFEMSWQLVPPAGKKILRIMAELAPLAVSRTLLRRILDLDEVILAWSSSTAEMSP